MRFLAIALLLTGCAAPVTVLRNDQTGQVAQCATMGTGIMGAVAASMAHDNCLQQYALLGFRPLSDNPQAVRDQPTPGRPKD